jgi:hypothetical protein
MFDQPFEALAARRERFAFGSSVLLLAAALLLVVLELAPVLGPTGPLRAPAPGVVGGGFAAPISPAVVPGPARPALSVSAGEPCAAYAPATEADMHPAINANMSFLIPYLPKKV